MNINYYEFWKPHIRFKKCKVDQLSPKIYKTLCRLNFGADGLALHALRRLRRKKAKGYVVILYAGEILLGYAVHECRYFDDFMIEVNFWIKKRFRQMKLGQILIKECIRSCPKGACLQGTTHDIRSEHLFQKYSYCSPKFSYT